MGSESFSALEMELEKCKWEGSKRDTLWKEKMKVPSESGFLKFTFVPTFGSLPTQHHIADAPSSLAEIGGNHQENTRNRHRTGAEDQATGSGKKGNSSRNSGQNLSQPKECNTSRGEMDKEDLFKAEFIILADSDEDTKAAMRNGYGIERTELLATAGTSSNGQIKTSYKAFAAIPTNTLLLEQKALDEPTIGEGVVEDRALDTHLEMCSPAQLRQQTEELCAAIDQVLQDPLAMRRCDSSPSSLDSDISRSPTPLQRPAGRETRFANLYLSGPAVTESQKTKPGVIRPTMVKAKIIVKEEEPVQPNPFKKYLEETIDLQTEQPTHPIVPIPEDEALSSKELCSAIIKDNMHLPLYQEKKDARKENFPGNERSPHSRAQCLLRGDFGNGVEKPC